MNTEEKRKINACFLMACGALLLSGIAIAISLFYNVNATRVTWDLIGVLSGILSFFVAVMVFMLGYNYVTYERRISKNTDKKVAELVKSMESIYLFFSSKNNMVYAQTGTVYGALKGLANEVDCENKYMSEQLMTELLVGIKNVKPEEIEIDKSLKYKYIESLRRLDCDEANRCIDFIDKCTIKNSDKIKQL